MISIDLGAYPDKQHNARLTADIRGNEYRWELEVDRHVAGWRMRETSLCRENLTLEQALDVLWEAENGEADLLLRALGVPDHRIAAAWARQHDRMAAPITQPSEEPCS